MASTTPLSYIIDEAAVARALCTIISGDMATVETSIQMRYFTELPNTEGQDATVTLVSLAINGARHTQPRDSAMGEFQATFTVTLTDQQTSIYAGASAVAAVRACMEGQYRELNGHAVSVKRIDTQATGGDGEAQAGQSGTVTVYGDVVRSAATNGRIDAVS